MMSSIAGHYFKRLTIANFLALHGQNSKQNFNMCLGQYAPPMWKTSELNSGSSGGRLCMGKSLLNDMTDFKVIPWYCIAHPYCARF